MLFLLDPSVARDTLDEQDLAGLETLALAVRAGRHLVVGARGDCERLSQTPGLGQPASSLFARCASRAGELLSIADRFERKVIVTSSHQAAFAGTRAQLKVRVRELAESEGLPKMVLLAEDQSDGELLELLAHAYRHKSRIPGCETRMVHADGHGDQMAVALKERLRAECAPVLCVADSDRRHATAPLGATATKCMEVVQTEIWWAAVEILPGHEIENLMGLPVLSKVVGGRSGVMALVELAARGSPVEMIRRWIDSKKGVYGKCIHSQTYDGDTARVLLEQASHLELPCDVQRWSECACKAGGPCSCVLISSFGTDLVRLTCAWIEEMGPRKFAANYLADEMEDIGRVVFEWAAAGGPIRV